MFSGGVADGEAVGLSVGAVSSAASANAGAVSERVNKVAEATREDRRIVFFEADTIEKLQWS
jgi:hypothetical protein